MTGRAYCPGVAAPSASATVRRTLYLRRRPLAAIFAFLAVLAILMALRPAPTEATGVVAAARPLPAGTVLAAGDLTVVTLPSDAVPEGAALADAEVLGRTLAGPLSQGSPVTATSVGTAERLARPGHLIVALPLSGDGIAALVCPGSRLDLLAPDGSTVASDVLVVGPGDEAGNLGTGSRSALIEVPDEIAGRLAATGGAGVTVGLR